MHPYVLMAAGTASTFAGLDPAWIAFGGALFGGAGLKIVEAWLGKDRVKIDDASNIRTELRQQVVDLRTELGTTEKERDEWRDKYYATLDKVVELKSLLFRNNIKPPE